MCTHVVTVVAYSTIIFFFGRKELVVESEIEREVKRGFLEMMLTKRKKKW